MMTAAQLTREQVLAWLEEVKDPEIPVLSVVELGVVRDVLLGEDGVIVEMTPTYSGCPALHVMEEEITSTLRAHGVASVEVRVVFREPWTTDWMSAEAKEKLRAWGIAPPLPERAGDDLVPLRRRAVVPCPYCASHETTQKSEFGSTACKAIFVCNSCRQPFDYFKAI
jgi:ring-1,2-phenylacetyl-CoA epoxidase subunit PaaD